MRIKAIWEKGDGAGPPSDLRDCRLLVGRVQDRGDMTGDLDGKVAGPANSRYDGGDRRVVRQLVAERFGQPRDIAEFLAAEDLNLEEARSRSRGQ